MQTIALTAHYNGQQILLDEPFQLEPGTALLVTVLPRTQPETDWYPLAAQSLAAAYGPDEPEYGLGDVQEKNPDYAAG